jgi:hypothetical protein
MPKLTMLIAAITTAGLVAAVGPAAEARTKKQYRQADRGYAHQYNSYRRRPASVGQNGLCQRDTGTPTSRLNLKNECDTQEFWQRQQDRAPGGDR